VRRDLTLPADSLLPGGGARPRREVVVAVGGTWSCRLRFRPTTMSAVYPPIPGDGADQVAEAAKGFDHHLDPVGEPFYGPRCVLVDQIQMHAGQERVMAGEPAVESLGPAAGSSRGIRFFGKLSHGRWDRCHRRSRPSSIGPPGHPGQVGGPPPTSLIPASSSSFSNRWI